MANDEIYGLDDSVASDSKSIVCQLEVTVKECVGLYKKSSLFNHSLNPYVIASLLKAPKTSVGKPYKTKIIKKTSNPRWDEKITFRVAVPKNASDDVSYILLFEIFDDKSSSHLGQAQIELDHQTTASRHTKKFTRNLKPKDTSKSVKSRGNITYELLCNRPISPSPARGSLASTRTSNSELQGVDPGILAPLPPGWALGKTSNGRFYFIDHEAKRTQWEHPITGESGRKNKRSTKSSENSSSRTQREQEPTNGSTVEQLYSTRGRNAIHRSQSPSTETSKNETPKASSTSVPSSSQPSSVYDLPTGWEMRTASSGRKYFIDHINKTTTWTDPRVKKAKQIKDTRHTKMNLMDADELLGPLPAGWEKKIHKDGREFFVDHNKQTTQWEDPRMEKLRNISPVILLNIIVLKVGSEY